MIHLAWSLAERLVPRLASAVIMFVLAAQLGPTLVGYYAWMILGVTFLQTAFDASVRQVSVMALSSRAGFRFLQRYRLAYALVGSLGLTLVLLVIGFWVGWASAPELWGLLPILSVPVLMSMSTAMIAEEQRRGGWKRLAVVQFRAVAVAFAVTLPVLLFIPSLLGPSLNLALIEALVFLQLRLGSHSGAFKVGAHGVSSSTLRARFREACVYSVLGWGQSQLDRVAVGGLGGAGLLGLYTFSWSISRSLGDAISNGAVNILRAKVFSDAQPLNEVKAIVRRSLSQTMVLVVVGTLLVYGAITWFLPIFLNAEWEPALQASYILVLCTVPQAISSASSVLLMHASKMKVGLLVRVVGLAFALPIGLCAVVDLRLGACAALLREILMCIVSMLIVRREAPWPVIGLGLAAIIVIFLAGAGFGIYS